MTNKLSKKKILWFDLSANRHNLNSMEKIKTIIDKTIKAHFTDIVIDVKNYTGFVAYPSDIAPHISESHYDGYESGYDLIGNILKATIPHDLAVHINLNTFSEGNNLYKNGPAIKHPEWQSVFYDGKRTSDGKTDPFFVRAKDYENETHSIFVNPIHDEVRAYELSIISEIIERYDIDGIVLDRARYCNLYADFSDLSKRKFEESIGETVQQWPHDIFEIYYENEEKKVQRGSLFKKWIKWRAGNIQSYFKEAEQLVHEKNPNLSFSTYVGSWYPLYFNEGVNWGSTEYVPSFDWAAEDYSDTGYAELLDFLMTGNYFHEVTKEEAEAIGNPDWHSVEGSAEMAYEALKNATVLYGSLFLKQYKNEPEQFKKAMKMALNKTQGIMLFDLVYLEEYEWWPLLEELEETIR